MYAQVLTPQEAESFKYNVLDLTSLSSPAFLYLYFSKH